MPKVIYSLNNAIDTFFSEAGVSSSKTECDNFVRQKYEGKILPVEIQGLTSYTVIAGPKANKIIQFREQTALLDMNMLKLAKDIHGEVVPSCSELGWVGDPSGSPLAIYEMNRLHGENFVLVRPTFTHDKRLNTVHSLAMFVGTTISTLQPANITWKFLCAVVGKGEASNFETGRYIRHQH
jgi:hypothetical protein